MFWDNPLVSEEKVAVDRRISIDILLCVINLKWYNYAFLDDDRV